MSRISPRPTVDELFAVLKRSSIATVLVEGKNDIIHYRKMEADLGEFSADMLPAGNKDMVLNLQKKLMSSPCDAAVIFLVDNDLWVHSKPTNISDVITTDGYSIESDLFLDGELINFLTPQESSIFKKEVERFSKWYALVVSRSLSGDTSCSFRKHPNELLDSESQYENDITLKKGEAYPDHLYKEINENPLRLIRGKSLLGLILRRLTARRNGTKYSLMQLMDIGASRKGDNYQRICSEIRRALQVKVKH